MGAEAIIAPGVKLWPGRRVAEGGKATASQVTAGQPASLRFSAGGALQGTVGEELTPETMVALGSLLGEKGQVALGWAGPWAAELPLREDRPWSAMRPAPLPQLGWAGTTACP